MSVSLHSEINGVKRYFFEKRLTFRVKFTLVIGERYKKHQPFLFDPALKFFQNYSLLWNMGVAIILGFRRKRVE